MTPSEMGKLSWQNRQKRYGKKGAREILIRNLVKANKVLQLKKIANEKSKTK